MIPDWKLERYRLGELSAAERESLQAQLQVDATLQARLEALDRDDAHFRAHYPRRTTPLARPDRARPWLVPAAGLAMSALVGVLAWQLARPVEDDSIYLKGNGPTLRMFRVVGAEPERLPQPAKVRPHDVVQAAFDLAGAAHAVVVSVDGAGHTTLHWPLDGDTRVPPGFKALPEAFELDEAPGFERFFLVTSNVPLAVSEIEQAAQRAGRTSPLQLPAGATQRSLLLEKVSP